MHPHHHPPRSAYGLGAVVLVGIFLASFAGFSLAAPADATPPYGHTPVDICHNGRTITVDDDAVPAHLNHGDALGACAPTEEPTSTPSPTLSPEPSPSPTPTSDPTPTPEPSTPSEPQEPEPTPCPSGTPSPEPTSSGDPTTTPAPTSSPTSSPTTTPSTSPTTTPSPSGAPSASPTSTPVALASLPPAPAEPSPPAPLPRGLAATGADDAALWTLGGLAAFLIAVGILARRRAR